MKRIFRLIERLRGKRADCTAQFPPEFVTETKGSLKLEMSALVVDDKEVMTFCRYDSDSDDKGVGGTFHPDIEKPPNPQRWQSTFDSRFNEFNAGWTRAVNDGAESIEKQIKNWLPEDVSVNEFLKSLKLARILVSEDGSVGLRFATSPLLQYHDLSLEFDPQNKLTHVSVEG